MKNRKPLLILISLISLISLSCGVNQSQPTAKTIEIQDFSFQPDAATALVGTIVTWINRDLSNHTVISDDGKFNSGNLKTGGQFNFTFSQPGTYRYHCNIHPAMTGVITITSAVVVEGAAQYTINTTTNKTLGTYLVNETGFTLYYFANDAPGNGSSACSGGCVNIWSPFYTRNVTVPTGLNATDFTTIARKDNMSQTAFKGWPMYHFAKDTKPGDANGNGFNGIWFVVNPMKFPPK